MNIVERLEQGALTKQGADELIMDALDYIRKLESEIQELKFDIDDIYYQQSMNG